MKKGELNAVAECAMMGRVVNIENYTKEDVAYLVRYIDSTVEPEGDCDTCIESLNEHLGFCKNPVFHHLSVNIIMGMKMLCITLSTDEDEEVYDLCSEDGVFSFVLNLSAPDLSELGYCFFQKYSNGQPHRVG